MLDYYSSSDPKFDLLELANKWGDKIENWLYSTFGFWNISKKHNFWIFNIKNIEKYSHNDRIRQYL